MGRGPLVGRGVETAALLEALRDADGAGVLLGGVTGVGKTSLAEQVLAGFGKGAPPVLRVNATEALTTVPFGALAPHLPEIPQWRANPMMAQAEALRQLVDRVRRTALISVDDVHLLDPASAGLLCQLAVTAPVRLLMTYRSDSELPDPVGALWRAGRLERHDVQPLSRADCVQLMQAILDGPVEEVTVELLWQHSLGNPLFLREAIVHGRATGVFAHTDGVWRWTGPWTVGRRLIDLVAARLRDVSPAAMAALELVAVGEPLGLQPLLDLAPDSGPAEAERRGLLVVERDGRRCRVRLNHPLYGDALRAGLGEFDGRQIRERLVGWHGQHGLRRAGDLLRDCVWRLAADLPADPAHFLAGAREALSGGDLGLAERLARAAGESADALLTLGTVLAYQHRALAAEEYLARVETDAVPDTVRATAAGVRARNMQWGLGRPNDADKILTGAQAAVIDADSRAELALVRGILLASAARHQDALAAIDGLLEYPQPTVRAGAAVVAASVAGFQGELERTLALVEKAQPAVNRLRHSHPWMDAQLEACSVAVRIYAGELREADALATESLTDWRKRGQADMAAGWTSLIGLIALEQGRLITAEQQLRLAATALQDQDAFRWRRAVLGLWARCLAYQRQSTRAVDALAAATAMDLASARNTEAWVALARPWVRLAIDGVERACEEALAAAETVESLSHFGLLPLVLHDAARLGATDVADKLAYWATRVEGPLPAVRAAHARALVNPTGPALESVGRKFAELSAYLLAAEAFQHAASLYRMGEKLADAVRMENAAAAALQHCEGARPPIGPDKTPLDTLTSRERNVAQLAARSFPSRDIAEQLGVSVRTVDNHLSHIYTKLGVRGRQDLKGLLQTR